MKLIKQFDQFHKTKLGLVVFALVELGLALTGLAWAKNGGGIIAWVLCAVFALGFVYNLMRLMEMNQHDND